MLESLKTTAPGDIVFYQSGRDSRFGIVLPREFWNQRAHESVRLRARESPTYGTVWEMDLAFNLKCAYWSNPQRLFSLYLDDESFLEHSFFFGCFTFLDGSRYYNEFSAMMHDLREQVKGNPPHNNFLLKKYGEAAKALRAWGND
jgi:hypothetical protein